MNKTQPTEPAADLLRLAEERGPAETARALGIGQAVVFRAKKTGQCRRIYNVAARALLKANGEATPRLLICRSTDPRAIADAKRILSALGVKCMEFNEG